MFGLPIGFASPLILSALALLPVIWWLLRLTPPRPREVTFPPTRLLLEIEKHEETPQKSPWWLTALRLLLAALLIFALAGPVWRPAERLTMEGGPLLLVIDNGWTSAKDWDRQVATAQQILDAATETGTPVMLLATAEGPNQPLNTSTAAAAGERLRALEPRAYTHQRAELITALRKALQETPVEQAVWISDGLEDDAPGTFQRDLGSMLGSKPLTVYTGLRTPLGLAGLTSNADALTVTVIRKPGEGPATVRIRAADMRGLTIGETDTTFADGATETAAAFSLPSELRNDIARLEITGERASGAVKLLDDSWRRRTVALVSGAGADQSQPLLSPLYYLQRALAPFADLKTPRTADLSEAIPELLAEGVSVVMLADVGRLPDNAAAELGRWVEGGGLLVRFAGPRTAGGTDDLMPVRLRAGDRTLGGSLSWEEPQKLAPFPEKSPFAGLTIPQEVEVTRQVLAEPTADLPDHSWAMLSDGTPLVTAQSRGTGAIVLFHVTADTGWSNLPLSGVYVDMLRRIVALSNPAAAAPSEEAENPAPALETDTSVRNVLPPLRLLDGFGVLSSPRADVAPIAVADFPRTRASRATPPGLYGADDGFRALNLLDQGARLVPLDMSLSPNAELRPYADSEPADLRAPLFLSAFGLMALDALIVLLLAGLISRLRLRRMMRTAGALVLASGLALTLTGLASPLKAQETPDDVKALEATLETRLAYVVTGNAEIDAASAAGLEGLSRYLAQRTALEPGTPMAVDISKDELSFYALLYWPVDPSAPKPDDKTMARIDSFMRNGGSILFDTRDNLVSSANGFGTTPATAKLREILDGLDVPPLEPVPFDHVLTKTFFLLESFPGRYATSPLWVEASEDGPADDGRPVRAGDGVSPILITGNDMAAAWAMDDGGSYLYPTVPDDPLQREYAFRAGVNIVMYSLTGNYKADQVHVPALLERLGQ